MHCNFFNLWRRTRKNFYLIKKLFFVYIYNKLHLLLLGTLLQITNSTKQVDNDCFFTCKLLEYFCRNVNIVNGHSIMLNSLITKLQFIIDIIINTSKIPSLRTMLSFFHFFVACRQQYAFFILYKQQGKFVEQSPSHIIGIYF